LLDASGLFYIVLSAETFNAASGINQFLFARKERVAGGTNFNLYVFYGTKSLNHIPTGTAYRS